MDLARGDFGTADTITFFAGFAGFAGFAAFFAGGATFTAGAAFALDFKAGAFAALGAGALAALTEGAFTALTAFAALLGALGALATFAGLATCADFVDLGAVFSGFAVDFAAGALAVSGLAAFTTLVPGLAAPAAFAFVLGVATSPGAAVFLVEAALVFALAVVFSVFDFAVTTVLVVAISNSF